MRVVAVGCVVVLLAAGCMGAAEDDPLPWRVDCPVGGAKAGQQDCMFLASTTPGSKIETWLSVNPTDPNNVVVSAKDLDPAKSRACVWGWYGVTHDAGATWKDVTIGGDFDSRAPDSPFFGYACNTDPKHTFAPDGRLHAIVEMYGLGASPNSLVSMGTRIVLATSEDGGLTWPAAALMWESDGHSTAPDFPSIAVSPETGTIVSTFLDFIASGRCYVFVSRDNGRTVEAPQLIPTPRRGCVALDASPDGTFVMALMGPYDGAAPAIATQTGIRFAEVAFARSTDDGRSFTFAGGFPLKNGLYDPNGNPYDVGVGLELAYDASEGPRRGTLYAVYQDDAGGEFDIFVRSSRDDGRAWSDPVRVQPRSSGLDRFMPNVAVAADGSIHVFYFDESWARDGTLVDVAHAVSDDGGKTWRAQRVSTASFDLGLGRHQNGGPDAGEYIGVAASADSVWVAVPESSAGGTTAVAVARVVPAT